jgi:hypothetical protein
MAVNWAPVGEQLAKQGAAATDAFDTRLGKLVSRGAAEERLKQDLLKTAALQNVEQTLIDSGYTPQEAKAAAGAAQGGYGSDVSAIGQAALRRQELGFRQQAVDAPDLPSANKFLAGVATGPVVTTDIQAGQVFNPRAAPTQQIGITDVGRAAIAADQGRAEQARAGAEENRAQAEKARREPAGRTGGGKPAAWTAPSQASYNSAFLIEKPGKRKDDKPTKMLLQNEIAAFNAWRVENDIANGEEALIRWRAAGRPKVGSGGAGAPQLPPQGGSVADFNAVPDDQVTVVTEATGPRGVPMNQLGRAATGQPAARTIVRTGTSNGRRVVQYSDGAIEYAN